MEVLNLKHKYELLLIQMFLSMSLFLKIIL